MAVGRSSGRDRRRTDGRHRRERGNALIDVMPALHQQSERGGSTRGDGPLEHGGFHRVDHRENELLPSVHGD